MVVVGSSGGFVNGVIVGRVAEMPQINWRRSAQIIADKIYELVQKLKVGGIKTSPKRAKIH